MAVQKAERSESSDAVYTADQIILLDPTDEDIYIYRFHAWIQRVFTEAKKKSTGEHIRHPKFHVPKIFVEGVDCPPAIEFQDDGQPTFNGVPIIMT